MCVCKDGRIFNIDENKRYKMEVLHKVVLSVQTGTGVENLRKQKRRGKLNLCCAHPGLHSVPQNSQHLSSRASLGSNASGFLISLQKVYQATIYEMSEITLAVFIPKVYFIC